MHFFLFPINTSMAKIHTTNKDNMVYPFKARQEDSRAKPPESPPS